MDLLKITVDQIPLEKHRPQEFLQSFQKFLILFR